MGNFRQHVNRKRKERERKRNRKNSRQKFKGDNGQDPMKSIAKALKNSLVISSSEPTTETQGGDSFDINESVWRESSTLSPKCSLHGDHKKCKRAKLLNRKRDMSGAQGNSSRENPKSLRTVMKGSSSVAADAGTIALLSSKNRQGIKDEMMKRSKQKLLLRRRKPVNFDESKYPIRGSDGEYDDDAGSYLNTESSSGTLDDEEEEIDVETYPPKPPVASSANKALQKMRVAQFRIINEMLYTSRSEKAEELFKDDRKNFDVYHEGYRRQVSKWSMNPLDKIISKITENFPRGTRIADLGCGEAKLAVTLKPRGYTVHSFDLVAANEHVRACNIRNVPLESESVDVAVMCLSLMGTDMGQFVLEANRILVANGELLVAEVESRIPSVDAFVKVLKRYGFALKQKDTARVFHFFDFRKAKAMPKGAEKNMEKVLWLKPCLYKKR